MTYLLSKKTSARFYAALTIMALLLSAFPAQVFVAEAEDAPGKVTICHATNAPGNPYIVNNPNANADVQGHDGHDGSVWYEGITEDWGDIIPPFEYDGGSYPGKNWDAAGQAIYNNDCQVPPETMQFDLMKKFSGPVPAGYTADQFTFYIDGVDDSIGLTHQTDAEATGAIELGAGKYTLGENGPAGFIPSQWTVQWSGAGCESLQGDTTSIIIEEDDLSLTSFGCRADNQWRYGTLRIEKEVVGTTADYENFEFTVTQGDMTYYDGAFESDGDNVVLVGAGDYTVVEDAYAGFTTTYSDGCTGIMAQDGQATCIITNTYTDTPQEPVACDYGFGPDNLLDNGSFEEPSINSTWTLTTITDWVITKVSDATGIDGELWKGLFGGASDGDQNVELDATEPTQLAQTVTTIPGATYELRFDFSPRPDTGVSDNDVDALVDGSVIMNANGDGNQITENTWTEYSETFIADSASTEIAFADNGSANRVGSLIDNAVLCLVEEVVLGCTDPSASNYNPNATSGNADAENCEYENQCIPASPAWATDVETANQGETKADGPITDTDRTDPAETLGASDWSSGDSTGFYSLGFGGSIVVSFGSDKYVVDEAGDDISIHEGTNGNSYPEEKALVEVSQDGIVWYEVGTASNLTNVSTRVSYFDIAPTGLSWVRYVRVTDTSDPALHADSADGFDLDAVDATGVVCEEPDNEVLGCTDPDALNYNEDATTDDDSCTYNPAPVCEPDVNLIENGDFETPTVTDAAGWDIFISGIAWLVDWIAPNGDATDPASLELHAGVHGWLPSEGDQYAELDGDYEGPGGGSGEPASTKISQTIMTIPGEEYTLSWDFSPRPNTDQTENDLEVFVNGDSVGSSTGVGGSQTSWTSHSYTFIADSNETTVALADNGTPNSNGTFVDNVALVCNPDDGGDSGDGDKKLYRIEGYVWHDNNENTVWDGFGEEEATMTEDELSSWTVEITNGDDTFSTTTDPTGYYYFEVPAGTWTIREVIEAGWAITVPVDNQHVVTVPEELSQSFVERVFAMIIPTAHAVLIEMDVYGPYNFGNNESSSSNGGNSSSSGGGGSTRPVCESFALSEDGGLYTLSWETRRGNELAITQNGTEIFATDDDDTVDEGSVLVTTSNAEFELTVLRGSRSDSCVVEASGSPDGQVLGEQISVVPLGAADAGAGGAAIPAAHWIMMLIGGAVRTNRHES